MTSNVAAFGHEAGEPLECLTLAIELVKETTNDGAKACGLRIGGGIDQDPANSPYSYPDNGIYITHIEPSGPAEKAGLKIHDKILQVNGYDFTMVTHEKAVHYIKKYNVLKMLVARQGVPDIGRSVSVVKPVVYTVQ
uniref:PDZ domain-containing protein n=1 Tax=Romanomermis culicivorax TaxID=13658 RepID=A0A915I9J9_ROMCU